MEDHKKYWKGLEELNPSPEFNELKKREFAEDLPFDAFLEDVGLKKATPRRDFLKTLGFGLGAATLAACSKAPIQTAIPYLIKPEDVTPGVANYYTSNFNGYSILVKTREGRPIKIEGNPACPVARGGVDAVGQASVLDVYDSQKLKGPFLVGADAGWDDVDTYVNEKLKAIKAKSGNIRILSSTVYSPSTQAAINRFTAAYPNSKQVVFDAVSYSAMIQANKNSFDKEVMPSYHFEKADVIVSFGADFLGTWISPVEFTKQYVSKRNTKMLLEKKMSKHFQIESGMSLTGTNADFRFPVKPSESGLMLLSLYNALAIKAGLPSHSVEGDLHADSVKNTAEALWAAKGHALVVSGSNDVSNQILVNAINSMLDSYGNTIDLDNPTLNFQGNDAGVMEFVNSMNRGQVDAVIFYGTNPVYNYAQSNAITEGLKKVTLKISFADRADETAALCDVIAPDHHYLESWNDIEAKNNILAIQQPTINPVFDSRAAQQSLLNWAFASVVKPAVAQPATPKADTSKKDTSAALAPVAIQALEADSAGPGNIGAASTGMTVDASNPGVETDNPLVENSSSAPQYYDFIKANWEKNIFPRLGITGDFTANWINFLKAGLIVGPQKAAQKYTFSKDLNAVVQTIIKSSQQSSNKLELDIYQMVSIRDGKYSNNPWLLELPDPVTKVTWDNYLAISQRNCHDMGLRDGDYVKLTVNGSSVEIPVLIQPGQAFGAVSLAVGYGRTAVGKAGNNIGKNAYSFIGFSNGSFQYHGKAEIVKTAGSRQYARTQTHDTIEGRDMIRETVLADYVKNSFAGSGHTDKESDDEKADVFYPMLKKGHHWGMSIDLNACTGCGACVVACVSENNIAVVGQDEVRRRREMHWIRIDRYYSFNLDGKSYQKESELGQLDKEGKYDKIDNVSVFHQPMLCQQCDHAPCETVCPVLATMHSSEGLNQQIYNRCFGTRYCANNCPYKVRRFNWFKYFDNDQFDYHMNDSLGKMVLNPDVVVRSRGVMEKCTFCVQRIQAGKLEAKIASRPLLDGEIKTACQQTCPANAIVFGDINDPNSEVSTLLKNERTYYVLEELGVQPGIGYMTKVRNRDIDYKEANPNSL